MKQHATNGWFHASEFMRAATVIHEYATKTHTHWLGRGKCKYISIYVDQRTGDFILRDREGSIIDPDDLYEMFPELK